MKFEEKINIMSSAEKIYAIYRDVSSWSNWDPDVHSSSINGSFTSGTTGILKPLKGPKTKISFQDVIENKSFTTISKLPLCSIIFEHELEASHSGTTITHRIIFKGFLSPLFGRLIGRGIKNGLPATLKGLKSFAESDS